MSVLRNRHPGMSPLASALTHLLRPLHVLRLTPPLIETSGLEWPMTSRVFSQTRGLQILHLSRRPPLRLSHHRYIDVYAAKLFQQHDVYGTIHNAPIPRAVSIQPQYSRFRALEAHTLFMTRSRTLLFFADSHDSPSQEMFHQVPRMLKQT